MTLILYICFQSRTCRWCQLTFHMAKSIFELPFQVWSKTNFSFLRIQYTALSEDQSMVSDHFCRCHGNEYTALSEDQNMVSDNFCRCHGNEIQRHSSLNLLTGKTYTYFFLMCFLSQHYLGRCDAMQNMWITSHLKSADLSSLTRHLPVVQACSWARELSVLARDRVDSPPCSMRA